MRLNFLGATSLFFLACTHNGPSSGPLGGSSESSTCTDSPIFLLNADDSLATFDATTNTITSVGPLPCPMLAATALDPLIAVDHAGELFVSDSACGGEQELYRVDLAASTCELTPFVRGESWGTCLRSLAFVGDDASPDGETLIFRGSRPGTTDPTTQFIGRIDTESSSDIELAALMLPDGAAPSLAWPLVGTGDGQLHLGYAPSTTDVGTTIGLVNQTSGTVTTEWSIGSSPTASESNDDRIFALWGSGVYLFNKSGGATNVDRFDMATGELSTVGSSTQLDAIAAAVSTCAP